jgi:outer membrane protein assembly factor BamB
MFRLLFAFLVIAIATGLSGSQFATASDWPQWLGPNRDSVWAETGILREFPKKDDPRGGLKVVWRSPISSGFSGPAVVAGKVYVTDRVLAKGARNPDDPFDFKTKVASTERVLCLDAKNGKEIWKHEYDCPYQISYPTGPRCVPTVYGGKVYTLGAMGDLCCLTADKGELVWSKNFPKDYEAKVPKWGFCGHPLVYKNIVVCIVGGEGSVVVAFDKDTGKEKWKALSTRDIGYSSPTLITVGSKDQVVIWHARAINGLEPLTGKLLWSFGLEPAFEMSIMAPRQSGDKLFAAGIGGAGAVLKLDPESWFIKPTVTPVWQEVMVKGKEMTPKHRGLYPVNVTPFIEGGTIYGVDQPGMMRAVELNTGKKLWYTFKPVIGKEESEDFAGAGSATAFIVKNGDRFFLFAETGELIIAKLSPTKYEEISRAKVLDACGTAFNRKVVWSHPAFANKCAFLRNDKEIVCVSLAAP